MFATDYYEQLSPGLSLLNRERFKYKLGDGEWHENLLTILTKSGERMLEKFIK